MKEQINPNIECSLKELLLLQAKKRNVSYSSIVEAAIKQYFDPDSDERRQTIMFRRIDDLSRKINNLSLDLTILSEGFALFIRNYLARLPDVPKEQVDAFVAKKEQSFKDYISALTNSLQKGNSLFNRLPREPFITKAEGETLLKQAEEQFND